MPEFYVDLRDYQFLLHNVMSVSEKNIPGYDELTEDFTQSVLDEAFKIARNELAPTNWSGDQEGCKLENGQVKVPEGFKEGFDKIREGGWFALDCDPKYGGAGLPAVFSTAVSQIQTGANMSLNMYPGLTHGVYSALHAHGSEEQKDFYLEKLVSQQWTGTMNLTEPHAGTDLGLIRTKAEPQDDGTYKISGTKIFISSGDHDMSENIIHLVLAKIPGGPDGVKGISLFIVPKFKFDENGNIGERNTVNVDAIEHKMGIHGNSTCVLNYDDAVGYLVGEPHKGLRYMFTMMNEARLWVGIQALSQAEAAYYESLDYAKERLQGRAVTGVENPNGVADPLIVHPDIRRNLMTQKSFVEGGRALAFWGAELLDRSHRQGDEKANELISLLIPVIKGYLTDKGFDSTVMAQQIFGGHGYIEETKISQRVRDTRITMIYEGANGIQALDLVGRKLALNGGAALQDFFGIVKNDISDAKSDDEFYKTYAEPLKEASKIMQATVMTFVEKGMGNPNFALSGATDFMHMFGTVTFGLMWLRMARAAQDAINKGEGDLEYYQSKLTTAKFFMSRILPDVYTLAKRVEAGEAEIMALNADNF